ncbi:lipid A 3-O-deacylase [Thermodesulfovibrio aggregans]|uniref:Lipid A 3-O-deacylase n=1 Tax=Thermodesulfovibrio aggregans TaxID=86166 RepID=A0A0U9HZ10_9BACT|nr:acyloxyacyl hydrolase [Thermodesulfovibrio aggregans]GAQ95701.1 lipid A 3-O-deacylase [Thermodesulfovibrio aggregans]
MRGRVYLFAIFLFILFFPSYSHSQENNFELGVGYGRNLFESLSTNQLLIAPAVNFKIPDMKNLWLHIEGDVEIINDDKTTVVAGVAPMLRQFLSDSITLKPFIEAGAGANITSRNGVENRRFGGAFIFSVMAGFGVEFKSGMKISYRFRHLSNAGLYSPNEGLNSHYLMFSIGF